MTQNKKIKQAFELSENPQKITSYYDDWALSYDLDVSDERYLGPSHIAQMADHFGSSDDSTSKHDARVLDAGCGTGLVGVALSKMGYSNIIGFDLSTEMIAKAEQTQNYLKLFGNIDMNKSLTTQINMNEFDVVVCCGVFTLGHVPPSSLNNLIDSVSAGGLVVFSAREEYCEQYDFANYIRSLKDQGLVEILKQEMAEYVSDDRAMYSCLRAI